MSSSTATEARDAWAVYELDDNHEATGTVHYYSRHLYADDGRRALTRDGVSASVPEMTEDVPDGTVCERTLRAL